MKIKKAIALMIGLVLIVSLALPGTLAVSVDQAAASSSLTVADGTEPTGTEAPTTEGTEAPTEGTEPTTVPTEPEATVPTEETEPTETTLPTDPETPSFDPQAVYDQLMACTTVEEMDAILDALTDEQYAQFTEEMISNIKAHYAELALAEEPELPIVSFTNVGPLLAAPAVHTLRAMRAAAYAADDNGVVLNKTATAVDGGYKITLEAYATGSSQTVVSTKPVDIVLVLDVSGSMDDSISRNDSTKKIEALKTAVNSFIDGVNTQSPDSQIAIVKFSGDKTDRIGNDTYYSGGFLYNNSQIVKNLTTVDADGVGTLKQAVNSLSPAGATRSDYGMELAQSIITGAAIANDGRKKVVIMFTDGNPTSFSDFSTTVANNAISASKGIKAAGATVYTIGVFNGANGSPVTATESDNTTRWGSTTNFNKYMHLVSSNYRDAESMTKGDTPTYPAGGKSYYLTPANSSELDSIFTQITQEVGGSTVTLDSTSYIQDTVSGQFTMPTGANAVNFYTMDCNGDGTFDESSKTKADYVTYEVTGNTLKVTNFDFSANWCGSHNGTYSGKKLIVEFTVTSREGFLGGNDVPTNEGTTDGIYNSDNTSLGGFTPPSVNVPIKDVTVKATDKNVYLLGSVTADQLKNDATVKVGDVDLNLSKANDPDKPYGLDPWQTEYVNITVTVKDKDGNVISGKLENLADDTTCTVTVTVSPITPNPTSTEGTKAETQTKSGEGKINVFKPELTFKDSTAYYGDDVPNLDGNLTKTEWKHGNTLDTAVNMTGDAPELDITCEAEAGKISDGKINTVQDIGVDVTVKIGSTDVTDKTTFWHENCAGQTCDLPDGKEFLIHVKSCTLTIKKDGWDKIDENQSFIFEVTGDNGYSGKVVVKENGSVTIKGLKIGTYTVTEVTDWSWRYEPATPSQSVTLTADKTGDTGTVTFNNTREQKQWLGGDAYNQNKFGNSN